MQMIRISAQTHITRACGATSKRYLRLGDFDDFKFGNTGLPRIVEDSEGYWPTEIVDYLSGKSVVVLDETKQL